MLRLPGSPVRLCEGIIRRDWLRVGALSALGLSLPELLQRQARAAGQRATADSCILIYLYGGPSQLETFDPKPNAPVEIRGAFGTIATTEPGVRCCEHLPLLAERLNKYAVIRTCRTSSGFSHHGGVYEALVMPADLAATVYQCLGIDPTQEMTDHQGRPLPLTSGRPVQELLSGRQ